MLGLTALFDMTQDSVKTFLKNLYIVFKNDEKP
mgnify:CR=1 FL=1